MDEFAALIGAAPTEAEKQKLIAQILSNRNLAGALGAMTGDRALAPLGQSLMQQSTDHATRLQQVRQNDIDDARTRMYYEGQLAHMEGLRREDERSNRENERLKGEENEILRLKSALPKATEADKARIKSQKKRFDDLSEGTASRRGNLIKAKDFLDAFGPEGLSQNNTLGLPAGFKGRSGAGRRILHAGGFGPVFTPQGQFEEQLDAFAETAARARLKALGETRPTDADVKGMKTALFGVGRDENTNYQLLLQYIAEQMELENELGQVSEDLGATYIDPEIGEEGATNDEDDRIAELEAKINAATQGGQP